MKNECFIGETKEKGEFYTKKKMKRENSIGDKAVQKKMKKECFVGNKTVQKNEKGEFYRQ